MEPNFWERRNDLGGALLRVTTLPFSFITKLELDESGEKILVATGLFQTILYELSKQLNFTTTTFRPLDRKWGGKEPNGTWNGMVGMLVRDQGKRQRKKTTAALIVCRLTPFQLT